VYDSTTGVLTGLGNIGSASANIASLTFLKNSIYSEKRITAHLMNTSKRRLLPLAANRYDDLTALAALQSK
jgi:hypothetical protein